MGGFNVNLITGQFLGRQLYIEIAPLDPDHESILGTLIQDFVLELSKWRPKRKNIFFRRKCQKK